MTRYGNSDTLSMSKGAIPRGVVRGPGLGFLATLASDIELGKLVACVGNIYSGGIVHGLSTAHDNSQVCVLTKASDQEHEFTSLDLELGKVG